MTDFFCLKFGLSRKQTCFLWWGFCGVQGSGATDDLLKVFDKRGFSSSKDTFDLSGVVIFIRIVVRIGFATQGKFQIGSFGGGFVEMDCPMVSVFPKL